jgi:hypothetical protein
LKTERSPFLAVPSPFLVREWKKNLAKKLLDQN